MPIKQLAFKIFSKLGMDIRQMSLRTYFIFAVAFIGLMSACLTYGQQTMLMGKVVRSDDAAISGAAILIHSKCSNVVAISDSLGLFATDMIDAGDYKMKIVIGDKTIKADKLHLQINSNIKSYYIISVSKKKVTTKVTNNDPFIASRIHSLGKEHIIDHRKGRMRFFKLKNKNDSTDVYIPLYQSVAPINPGMK